MAEARTENNSGDRSGANPETQGLADLGEAVRAGPGDPGGGGAPDADEPEPPGAGTADGAEAAGDDGAAVGEVSGPSLPVRALRWLFRWHPLVFLGGALALAAYAWQVYPRSEERTVPPAETFYHDGLDRLRRVLNPDLPLIAASPTDEALAARGAFLNLFLFYRENLKQYPFFINPHLLLAEANRILAGFNPALAEQYWTEAAAAYADAAAWEDREDDPARFAVYLDSNFLGGRGERSGGLDPDDEELALRRGRRREYIAFRRAEAEVNLGRFDAARLVLEGLRQREDRRRRDELRLFSQEDRYPGEPPRHAFELGPDQYPELDLLLAKVYDGLGQLEPARGWFLRYLSSSPASRNHAFVFERLAEISMSDGEVYRRSDAMRSERAFRAAAGYFREVLGSPFATREQRDGAVLGLAVANSRLAEAMPAGEMAGVDRLSAAGRTVRSWLERFSGQPLPGRTLEIPLAVGEALARPELLLPSDELLFAVAAGNLSAMAGGRALTPYEQRRRHLVEALENFDRVADGRKGTREGDRAAVMAARESWNLGDIEDTEARLEAMLDPLSTPEVILAARAGLAEVALARGDLPRAHMLILGGHAHPSPLWFSPSDADWRTMALRLGTAANRETPGVWRRMWELISPEGREIAAYAASGRRLEDAYVDRFLNALNAVLRRADFHTAADFPPQDRGPYLRELLERDPELLTPGDVVWQNRMLMEEALPYDLSRKASRDVVGFEPFPEARDLYPGGLVDAERVRRILLDLARARTARAASAADLAEQYRMRRESNAAYQAALDRFRAEPGETLYEMARNYEALAELREAQGRHLDALSFTAAAARAYLDVSFRARGSPREMDALLSAGEAFFRAGLLERAVESQQRFLDRFGYYSPPGGEGAMAVARAENLLGRAHWFLGDTGNALAAFRRNIPRQTPERYKSIYYIGRVLLEEGLALDQDGPLGSDAEPLPPLDRDGNPVIGSALQAFNYLRQSPGVNPAARAWRWATFDLARLRFIFADRARRAWENSPDRAGEGEVARPWLPLYDTARVHLTEALERYPLRRNGGIGLSVRVEPEDYADTMAARFEAEYLLARTLLVLADERRDESLYALARAHLNNLRDKLRYADALFDATIDRFQQNAAIIREEVEGGNWDRNVPLPRTRLGDDEGPTRGPARQIEMLRNAMLLLGDEYFRAGERERQAAAAASAASGRSAAGDAGAGYYQDSYRVWQDVHDRFGPTDGVQAMVKMGDSLARLGAPDDAANHYRMGANIAATQAAEAGAGSGPGLEIGAAFWGEIARQRLRDLADGYSVP